MKKYDDYRSSEDEFLNSDEPAMPEGWEPAMDDDLKWQGIVRLLNEANSPVVPANQRFEEILASAKSGMASPLPGSAARIESIHQTEDESFGPWLKSVAVGGGIYAQVLRFGAIAAATVLVTLTIGSRPENTDSPTPSVIASAPEKTVSSGSVPTRSVELRPEDKIDPTPVPVRTDAGTIVPVSMANQDFAINGDWRNFQNEPGWNSAFLYSNADTNPGQWAYGLNLNSRNANRPAVEIQSPEPFAKQRLLNSIQQLRFNSLVDRNPEDMETISQMETALRPLLKQDDVVSQSEIYALELYQRAEDLLSKNRFEDSIRVLEEIERIVPGSFMSFLARYRVASVEFENLKQFDHALSDYQQVLQNFPTHFVSETHQKRIMDRVDLMLQNYEPGWDALSAWQDVQKLTGEQKFAGLKELIKNYPHLPVACDALEIMQRQVLTDPTDQWVKPDEVTQLAQMMLTAAPQHPEAGEILFLQGEVAFRRLYDLEQARRAYQQVSTRSGGDEFAEVVDLRLTQLANATSRLEALRGRGQQQ